MSGEPRYSHVPDGAPSSAIDAAPTSQPVADSDTASRPLLPGAVRIVVICGRPWRHLTETETPFVATRGSVAAACAAIVAAAMTSIARNTTWIRAKGGSKSGGYSGSTVARSAGR